MLTPQHCIRYEIRSTTGTGNLNSICSQVASEGSASEVGYSRSVFHPAGVAANTVGTVYPIKGVRALTSRKDLRILVSGYSGSIASATSDAGTLMLLNPTLSAPLTWAASDLFDEGTAPAGQTVTSLGTIIDSVQLVSSAGSVVTPRNRLSTLSVGIDNALGNVVLAYMPLTGNQSVSGSMSLLV